MASSLHIMNPIIVSTDTKILTNQISKLSKSHHNFLPTPLDIHLEIS